MGLKPVPFVALLLLCLAGFYSKYITAGAAADRMVFCHNVLWSPVYNGSVGGFKQEILVAQSYGIQAFALNLQVWRGNQKLRAEYLYQAAEELGTGFKLFFSPDFGGTGNNTLTPANVVDMLTTYKNHPNQLYYQGKQFLSSYQGQDLDAAVWRDQILAPAGNNIFFIPFFKAGADQNVIDGVINKFASVIDGLFAWDSSAWPYFDGDYNNPSTKNDVAYLASTSRANKSYMASVSPWYFNHIQSCNGSKACPSNEVMGNYQGPGLWMVRWNQLITQSSIQLVEIISWNDWQERHYVTTGGTVPEAQPEAADHNHFPHQAFLELGAYYISWFKTGNAPAITKDTIYLFYYSHSKNAKPSNDTIGPVANADVLDDKVYTAVKLTAAATVRITSGGTSQDFSVAAGVGMVGMPFNEGTQSANIIRNGATIASVTGDLPITNTGFQQYDFNVYTKF